MSQKHEPQQCSICEKTFEGTVHLRIHVKHHQQKAEGNNAPFVCNMCGSKHYNQFKFDAHLLKEHDVVNPDKLQCHICKVVFRREGTFKKHMECHEKGFSCSVCSETFAEYNKLRSHGHKHHKKYCKLCPKQFNGTEMGQNALEVSCSIP